MTEPSLYGVDDRFVDTSRGQIDENRNLVRQSYPVPVSRHEALLDLFHQFVALHVWTFHLRSDATPVQKLLFSATHKNLIALFAILENVLGGLFGPVRPLFRQVVEAQLLAKYAIVRSDEVLAERWLRGESLSVSRLVLGNLYEPHALALRTMWQPLHRYVHHTTASQQVSISVKGNLDLAGHDLTVMGMLLHTQYHLISRHSFNRAERYYAERYADTLRIPNLRRAIRSLLSEDIKEHGKDVKRFIRAYRATWRSRNGETLHGGSDARDTA